jgi:CHAT domain-containing protein/tetratricopeptide (TPR) repeat protein
MPHPSVRGLIPLMVLSGWAAPGLATEPTCTDIVAAHAVTLPPLKIHGIEPATLSARLAPGHEYLIEVREGDKDALVELLDARNQVTARADHPERRTGIRRIMVTATTAGISVRVAGKEPGGMAGTATVRLLDRAKLAERPDCLAALSALAKADADYAAAEDTSAGRASASTPSARDTFLRAAAEYEAPAEAPSPAEKAIASPADPRLQGEAALAVAGVDYFDLQDWDGAARWAAIAAKRFGSNDPYRKARAETLLAESWIEIEKLPSAASSTQRHPERPEERLVRARELLERVRRFHEARREEYDVALQLTNIASADVYQGRYRECVTTAAEASRRFAAIRERVRSAQALQNKSLCLWGLGRLQEALLGFERALKNIGPEASPTIYVISITNTALAHFALGHFDESLRLYNLGLEFTRKIHSPRNEAYCLYGIGVNYYALGNFKLAQHFLEESLAIRTAKLDSRGRLASLRALASLYADQGEMDKALAKDQEALNLAVAPSAIARLKIQLAVHTAAAGREHWKAAKAQLDEVISRSVEGDPTIQAEALVQRAMLLREMGLSQQALSDLQAARPKLHAFGNVTQEFEADLELARTLRTTGQSDAALQAVDRALGYADAVRLQTANPELRAQLQNPLRPAYDIKLELLRTQFESAVEAGRNDDAKRLAVASFATADASRARTFSDVAAQQYAPALREALAPEFRRRELLYRELAARRNTLETRLDSPGTPDDPRTQRLIAEIGELEREVDAVNTQIATRAGTARGRTGAQHPDLPKAPADTALVSYWLGAESSFAWVVLPHEIHWCRLAAPGEIAARAEDFHDALTNPKSLVEDRYIKQRAEDSRLLYQLIVKPLEPWLSNINRWVLVPDGALDYIPFAALRASDKADSFVIMQHDLALTPAAWTLDATRTQAASPLARSLLMVADPVYEASDPRRGTLKPRDATSPRPEIPDDPTSPPFRRLLSTGVEARQISALFPRGEVDQLIGLDATREQVLSRDWSAYRLIHFATHGVVDAQVPQLSALVLGYYDAKGAVADPAVRTADISLRTLSADVVVLSACETALGKEVRSEGLVGLGSTMLARGARAVVASLWPVVDESGARVMTDFYWHLLHGSPRPERALGLAMRTFVSHDRLHDPVDWAAFQVSVATLVPAPLSREARTASSATP